MTDDEDDLEAFTVHRDGLLVFARGLLGDWHEAEDVVQETFCRYWKQAPRPRRDLVRPWLFRVTRGRAVDRLRKRKPRVGLRGDDGECPPDTPDPGLAAAQQEQAASVLNALAHLPPAEREALALRLAGVPTSEAMLILTTARDAFYAAIYRAVRRLRDLLFGSGEDTENPA